MKLTINKSLRTKLLFTFFLISFLPAVFVGVLNFEYTRLTDKQEIFSEILELNKTKNIQILQQIENDLDKAYQITDRLTTNAFDTMSIDERSQLREQLSEYGFSQMLLADRATGINEFQIGSAIAAGKNISSLGMDSVLYRLWNTVRKTERISLKADSLGTLYFGMPQYDNQGAVTHILILTSEIKTIEMLTSLDFSRFSSRESYLIDDSFHVLTSPGFVEGMKQQGMIYDEQIIRDAILEDSSIDRVYSQTDGHDIILAAEHLQIELIEDLDSDVNWYIITQMDQAELSVTARKRALYTILFVLLITAVVQVIGFFIIRKIIDPIIDLTKEVSRLSEGYLDIHVKSDREDEIGQLLNNTDFMVNRIREVVSAIRSTIDKTNSLGTSIAASVEQQSAIAVEQAGSITEISTTMDEFTSSFAQVSDNVKAVSQMSEDIYTYINESSQLIDSMAEKIRDINVDNNRDIENIMELKQRSKDIAKVMEIINSISDQTKIIAFNAALEASSAGEAGKRFGVVAAEIRKLTESVSDSTSNIDKIIKEIQNLADQMVIASEKTTKNITKGLEYSTSSVENIDFIVKSIKTTSESSQQIALSVQQQQTAANQIQTGLQELSSGAQQNSEAIQTLNESGSEFKRIGKQLSLMIKRFKFSKET